MPDTYGGKYRDDKHTSEELVELYTGEVQRLIEQSSANGKGIGCFIAESLQSCGGQIILPPGYLRKVYKYVTLRLEGVDIFKVERKRISIVLSGVLGMLVVSALPTKFKSVSVELELIGGPSSCKERMLCLILLPWVLCLRN